MHPQQSIYVRVGSRDECLLRGKLQTEIIPAGTIDKPDVGVVFPIAIILRDGLGLPYQIVKIGVSHGVTFGVR